MTDRGGTTALPADDQTVFTRERTVVITNDEQPLGIEIAAGLHARGLRVTLLLDAAEADDIVSDRPVGSFSEVRRSLRSRPEIELGLVAAGDGVAVPAVVHAWATDRSVREKQITDITEDDWDQGFEAIVRETIVALQAAASQMDERGGSIVIVVPTIGFAGARGYSMLAAASEAQRALVRSVARSWGPRNIRVNCVAAPPARYGTMLADCAPATFQMPARSLPNPEPHDDSLAGCVAFLLGSGASEITGATLCADGGSWMQP